jgi:tripartite-type tricarboxylate transporter receptor subunit TctC
MTTLRIISFAFAAFVAATTGAVAPASAQNFPSQRVTIVVPFGPGSVTDIMARILADEVSKKWGQTVIVENRPGLAGTTAVAKAAPDGYTLMVTSNGHTVAALVSKNISFDPVKDFAGITRVSSSPLALIVNPDVPAKDLKELIAYAKANPGKLNFSSPGLASTTFIAGALFRKAANIDLLHVPFKSVPEAISAVIRGDAHMYFAPINMAKEQSEGGKVRVLGAVTATRHPAMPNLPTFREAGLDFVYDSWFGLMAPAAVPRDIISKVNRDVVEILQSPSTQAKLAVQSLVSAADTPEAFDKIIRDDTAKMTEIFKEITN